jgi:hypothetical protein
VKLRKAEYNLKTTSKAEKNRIVNEILQEIRSGNPPAKFLARPARRRGGAVAPGVLAHLWYEVRSKRARAKVLQALREKSSTKEEAEKEAKVETSPVEVRYWPIGCWRVFGAGACPCRRRIADPVVRQSKSNVGRRIELGARPSTRLQDGPWR